jgi:hypothetical protein
MCVSKRKEQTRPRTPNHSLACATALAFQIAVALVIIKAGAEKGRADIQLSE